jgi:hypothetical protein
MRERLRRLRVVLLLLAGGSTGCSGAIEPGTDLPSEVDAPGRPTAPRASGGATGGAGAPPASSAGPTAPPGSAPAAASPARCEPELRRIWRFTPAQIRRNLEALFGAKNVPAGLEAELDKYVASGAPFSNAADVPTGTPAFIEHLVEVTRALARGAVRDLRALHACFGAGVSRPCVSSLVSDLGARAWRRPVTDEEVKDYLLTFDAVAAASDPPTGVEYVLRRLLLAPDMLFRFELGARGSTGQYALEGHELANALAYTLTDAPPDAELLAAGRDGSIKMPGVLASHARRLVGKPTAEGLVGFLRELFGATNPPLPAQAEELRRFIEHALWSDGGAGRLGTLLTAEPSFANGELQRHYGWNAKSGATAFEAVTPPAAEARAGILTRGAVIGPRHTRSARGKFVREVLLCLPVPQPPLDVDQDLDAQAKVLTQKLGRPPSEDELLANHMADPACSGCHTLIDPLGKPFSAFDDKGVWRAIEKATSKPFETSADILQTGELDGPVKDPRDLARKLAGAPAVRACIARHAVEFVTGRPVGAADECRVREATARFEATGGDLKELFVALVTSEAFGLRRER